MSRIDPLNPIAPLVVSSYRWFNGPIELAAPPARRAMELLPAGVSSMLHVIAASQIAEAGFREELVEVLRRAAEGLEVPAEGISNEFSARITADGFALLGLEEEAVRWVRRAVDLGCLHWPNLAEGAHFLESVRGTTAFQALLDERAVGRPDGTRRIDGLIRVALNPQRTQATASPPD